MYAVAQTPSRIDLQNLILAASHCAQCADPACLQECDQRADLRRALVTVAPGMWWTQERNAAEAYADEAIQESFA